MNPTKKYNKRILPTNQNKINSGDKTIDNLYQAVINYIQKRNGTAVVIGGIALVDEGDAKFNYGVMVRVTGIKPSLPTKSKKK